MIYDSKYMIDQVNRRLDEANRIKDEGELAGLLAMEKGGGDGAMTEALLSAFSELRLRLGEHMKLDDVLFLFGNGATMYAGSRDTRSFALSDYAKRAEYAGIRDIIEAAAGLRGIEEQLNALTTIRAYYRLVRDDREATVVRLIDDVKRVLIDCFVNSVDYRKLSLHEIFLLKLRAFGCLGRTSIYTPNYDLAFEYTLDRLGIEYRDGFTGFVNRTFDPRTLQERGGTALIKIHGSVNWLVEDDRIKEAQPRFRDGRVEIGDTASVLIYPTSNKLFQTYSTPYSELMRHMLDRMEVGRNVVTVIGYKYGDDHINEILFKALGNPNNIFYFFLFDPGERGDFIDSLKRLSESMPNVNILTGRILGDFENFVKYMLPATPEKTDQEKAFEMLRKVLASHEE